MAKSFRVAIFFPANPVIRALYGGKSVPSSEAGS